MRSAAQTKPLSSFYGPKYWPTWFGVGLLRTLSLLPLPLMATAGYSVGMLYYALAAGRRKIALTNLKTCFPECSDTQLKRINRKHFCYLGQTAVTASMNWWISPARFDRLVTIKDREHFDSALEEGRRIILLTPHFLAIEVSGLALQRERPMVGMYQYMKNQLLNTLALSGRSRFCNEGVMFERKEPLRAILRPLMKGLPMAYSPDQDAGRKGVFVPFFTQQASTSPALGKFVRTLDAVVIPCRNHMLPWGGGYEVTLGQPIVGFSGDEEHDAALMNSAIEEMVKADPAQYLWVHKRYKTRPEGEPKFYR